MIYGSSHFASCYKNRPNSYQKMWLFFVVSSASDSKKKVSKRTSAAEAKAKSIYPAPGHKSCILPADLLQPPAKAQPKPSRRPVHAPTHQGKARPRETDNLGDEHDEEEVQQPKDENKRKVSILTVGGAMQKCSKLWFECSRPVISHFTIYEGDVVAEDASYIVKLTGKYYRFLDPLTLG